MDIFGSQFPQNKIERKKKHMKTKTHIIYPAFALFALFALACLAFVQSAQAVSPAPDGGYPAFNTAEGQNALFGLTTGVGNTAVGWFSLSSNTDGSFNTGVGVGTLLFNVGDQSTGEGVNNTALGGAALLFNTTGSENTALGTQALLSNTEGGSNTAVGRQALISNTTGNNNTANGFQALYFNTTASNNTATGYEALAFNTTGENNIAIGSSAGINVTTGNNNICIGNEGEGGDSDVIRIGNLSHAQILIPAINNVFISGDAVFINPTNGRLGTMPSSLRFKQNIKPMDKSSEAILELTPVTFCYKKDIDPQGIQQFGLLAEDVEKVNSKLVVRDKEGKAHSVRYEAVNAMLLNEFLKEHRTVQELRTTVAKQEATIAQQQRGMDAVAARLDEQAAQIQKVSAELEASKPAPHVVNNP
jgi:trimeric autotransporter adhesin